MATGTVTFTKLLQDSQDLGSDDEHMVSRAYCMVDAEGQQYETYMDIKQPVGGNFEADELEVSLPAEYSGPVNYAAMRAAAEEYYRSLVGSSGSGIRVEGASSVRMRDNTFIQTHAVQVDFSNEGASW